jgi:hypothetical protein
MSKSQQQIVSAWITADLARELRAIAQREDRSVSSVIRRALSHELDGSESRSLPVGRYRAKEQR